MAAAATEPVPVAPRAPEAARGTTASTASLASTGTGHDGGPVTAARAVRVPLTAPWKAAGAAWAAALLALASAPLHAVMLFSHPHSVVLTGLMTAMVLWCLGCALGVLRGLLGPGTLTGGHPARRASGCQDTRSLRHLWSMAVAMALLHVWLLTGFPVAAHHHGASAASGTEGGATASTAAGPLIDTGAGLMLAVIAVELAVCFACALALRTRSRRAAPRRAAPGRQIRVTPMVWAVVNSSMAHSPLNRPSPELRSPPKAT